MEFLVDLRARSHGRQYFDYIDSAIQDTRDKTAGYGR